MKLCCASLGVPVAEWGNGNLGAASIGSVAVEGEFIGKGRQVERMTRARSEKGESLREASSGRASESSSQGGRADGGDLAMLAGEIEDYLKLNALAVVQRDGAPYLLIPKHHAFTWPGNPADAGIGRGLLGRSRAPKFYEETTTLLFSYLIGRFKPASIIDAGAGIGYFSRVASSRTIDPPEAHAFELRDDRLNVFRKEIASDPFGRLITVVKAGLTDHHIGDTKVWSARSHLFEKEPSAAEYKESWVLRCLHYLRGHTDRGLKSSNLQLTSIDHYCSRNGLEPGLIKIDVEGYEGKVLDGARETLATAKPLVVLELHRDRLQHDGNTRLSVVQRLFDHGYKALFLTDHHNRLACRVVVADVDNPLFRRQETDLILFVPG